MKVVRSISFDGSNLPGGAPTILKPAGCELAVVELIDAVVAGAPMIHVRLHLDEGDPRIVRVFELLQLHGTEAHTYTFYEFTEEERQAAPLLVMDRDANENVVAGAIEGTKYDLTTACPQCGSGARQASPLYIFYEQLQMVRKHRAIGSSRGAILVDGGMVKKLRDNNVTGIAGFGEVYARMKKGGRSLVAREQIFMNHTLPPEAPSAQLDRSTACPLCRRAGMKGVGGPPWRTVYRRQDLSDIRDFNQSWEWYGEFKKPDDPRKLRVPRPVTLVTPKVMNIFREAGVTTFEWTPIFVED